MIAGAGLGGSRCAETLRARGWQGRVLLVGDESHAPYERPALSKAFLAGERDDVTLRPRVVLGRTGNRARARSACRERRCAASARNGRERERLSGIRSCSRPACSARRLDGPPGVHHLRTLDDARALRAELTPNTRVVVIGAGFVGGEVASTLSGMVRSVTVVEPAAAPLERVLGPEVGAVLADRYRAHGVELRLGTGVTGFTGDDRVTGVRLSDGTGVAADLVVVGIGSVGATVTVDECGRSATPGVYACGDIAVVAAGQGDTYVSSTGRAPPVRRARSQLQSPGPRSRTTDAPYFWSDQFGLRLQHIGHAESWHTVLLEGERERLHCALPRPRRETPRRTCRKPRIGSGIAPSGARGMRLAVAAALVALAAAVAVNILLLARGVDRNDPVRRLSPVADLPAPGLKRPPPSVTTTNDDRHADD